MYEAERGLFDLRQGRALYVGAPGASGSLVATVDGLGAATLDTLRCLGAPRLAVTHRRAATMGLAPPAGGASAAEAVSLALNGEGPDEILRLASARGPFRGARPDVRAASAGEVGGLTLARLGRLLPAVVAVPADPGAAAPLRQALAERAVLAVTAAQVSEMADDVAVEVVRVSDGPVPLPEAEDARFVLYREANGLREHVAVLIAPPERWPDPVPVRIHSACLTGDLFGSLRCDCGEQLRGSVRLFAERGGVLLYMAQEGRDIGLANKLRAYRLQADGLDTIDADETLGFGADERRYGAAVEILQTLGVRRVRLLTNNPEKVQALRAAGVEVVDRLPLFGTLNPHNRAYVATKVDRAGHWLHDMLSGGDPAREPSS